MPKGDRLKLKADPEDGTTPVANLLLEAVAMAKLSGLQKGAIVYLWRKTYGWLVDGKRLKESKITLKEWEYALCASKSRISTALKELEQKNIFHRRVADQWGGYYYTLNTDISKWNSNTVNIARLSEMVTVAHFGTITKSGTVAQNGTAVKKGNSYPKKNGTVAQNGTEQLPKTEPPTLYKEILKKDKERGAVIKTTPFGEDTKTVFGLLDKERGYRPPKRKAEAASIIRMLKAGYSPEQVITTWRVLKEDKFWQKQELYMMTVESHIGAVIKSATHRGDTEKTKQPSSTYKAGDPLFP